jgi:hypothetical protein
MIERRNHLIEIEQNENFIRQIRSDILFVLLYSINTVFRCSFS